MDFDIKNGSSKSENTSDNIFSKASVRAQKLLSFAQNPVFGYKTPCIFFWSSTTIRNFIFK